MAMAAIRCAYLNPFMYFIPIDMHYEDSTHILSLVCVRTDNFILSLTELCLSLACLNVTPVFVYSSHRSSLTIFLSGSEAGQDEMGVHEERRWQTVHLA